MAGGDLLNRLTAADCLHVELGLELRDLSAALPHR